MCKNYFFLVISIIFLTRCGYDKNEKNDAGSVSSNKSLMDDINGTSGGPCGSISFSNTVAYSDANLTIDSSLVRLNPEDSIVTYHINATTHEVLRVGKNKSRFNVYLNNRRILQDKNFYPSEFVDKYLFYDLYIGGDIEGKITKFKYELNNEKLNFVDSITGGVYSEGAGVWEWLINQKGDPVQIVFDADDVFFFDDRRLLISTIDQLSYNRRIYLINYQEQDTLLNMSQASDIGKMRKMFLLDSSFISYSFDRSNRCNFLNAYGLSGDLKWSTRTWTFNEMLFLKDRNLLITSGYRFINDSNKAESYLVRFDLKTGRKIWDIPIKHIYNINDEEKESLNVADIFEIGFGLYGVIMGKSASYAPDARRNGRDNMLIIINEKGELVHKLSLSKEPVAYEANVLEEGNFELISHLETRSFYISPQ